MVTPFDERGRVDEEAAVRLMNHLVEHGSDGLVICGTTGEAATLDDEEHLGMIALAVREMRGRGAIVAGVGSNDTRHAVWLTERATEIGPDALLSVNPYYNRPSRRGIVAHYREVVRATDLPILLYNIPQRTGADLPNDLLAELAQLENIFGVKQANPDNLAKVDGLAIYAGNDDMLVDVLELGEPADPHRQPRLRRRDAPDGRRARAPSRDRRRPAGRLPRPGDRAAGRQHQGGAGSDRDPRRRPPPSLRRARRRRARHRARDARAPRHAGHRRVSGESSGVLPLGGLGEIGKNMTVVEYDDRIVVVDTGLRFPTTDMLGIDLVLPDFAYLRERAEDIEAIVITHGHEDHLGALPWVLRELGADGSGPRRSSTAAR